MEHKQRALIAAALVLVAFTAMAGCASGTEPLEGVEWRLTEWTVSSIDPDDVTITAAVADGQISGNGGVNNYSGPCEVGPGHDFSVGQISATQMASEDPDLNRAESIYFELLGGVASYKLDGTKLTLFDGHGNESLIFEQRSGGA